MANSCLPNIEALWAAGLNPKTGLPYKFGGPSALKENMKKVLRVIDEQDCINRYRWYNLPRELDGQLIERILYYRGQGAFFYMESMDKFYFLPFVLNGDIDVYGRYTGVTPLMFNGAMNEKESKAWIKDLVKNPQYEIILPDELDKKKFYDSCVLLNDYSKQISQRVLPRQVLNEGIIEVESDLIPFLRTSLMNNSGVAGMRVQSEDESSNVLAASESIKNAALEGQKYVPIVGQVDFQDLATNSHSGNASDYLMTFQALDNFRLSTIGIQNGGVWQKKEHMLETEFDMNSQSINPAVQDGLSIRQNFCDIVNSIWGLGIWCEPSEATSLIDMNGDGVAINDEKTEEVNNNDMQ